MPAPQSLHIWLFADALVPCGQGAHTVDDACAKNPFGQTLHSLACDAGHAYVPAPHGSQLPRVLEDFFPPVHAVQFADDTPAKNPAGHTSHFLPSGNG